MDNQRNLILAVVLSAILLFGWDFVMRSYFPEPEVDPTVAASEGVPGAVGDGVNVGGDAVAGAQLVDVETALATTERVEIDAPEIIGSINLAGARIDDIELKSHRKTVEEDSGPVQLMAPRGTADQHFARFDWVGEGVTVPDAQTVWTAEGGELTQDSPVRLSWDNGEGQVFTQTISIDDAYMLTVEQGVTNNAEGTIALTPRGLINRDSRNADQSNFNVHSGPIAVSDGTVDFSWDYDEIDEEGGRVDMAGQVGWIGFTDIYWMSALIPETDDTRALFTSVGPQTYAAVVLYNAVNVPSGETVTRTTRLFAGAKESAVLDEYEAQGVERFGLAIDWGWFRWIAWPMWQVLIWLFGLVGNFGLAIIGLTLIIRLVLFPVAQKQFHSMAQMRAVQPKMKALQERYKDDKPKLQQEMAKLYKEEKVNPLAGCLPIFIQIPIFFALYKVLRLAIEMRHEPFYGWIRDLSAPDPATILNLFGLLPFDPPGFLAIGVLAVLLGFTMWLQFKLNPAAMDPMQQQIFMIMPWVLMFVMAPFAAGLLLYWISNNVLTLAQQKYLYSRNPQLREQMLKEKEEKARAAEREKAAE
ncbi:membrane protein insertase YidC [Aurantiacibacter sp. MUD11]|uniref:membrane protein insertase YidC n=1 Tax=Aurantiacibacter sp. MUD11 TaxID=3003265 RepID=UPI0022AB3322|nr:membrane protein insertase YidC [Aurantiacibacter sp. MUD11]WAT16791.1 membrane protein insertase YidC [Aurantiacibacter sp. MUD11]